jgi:hypothetical protein
MDLEDEVTKKKVEGLIRSEVATVKENPSVIKQNGCAACHILFSIINKLQVSEQDAADLLSEILLDNSVLNDDFIAMVEDIHMRSRCMGTTFVIKNREAKDRYIESNFKNTLAELLSDASNLSSEIVLRKLILSDIALSIAQNLGIDFHAAKEELYYYMRKNEDETDKELLDSIRSVLSKGQRTRK